MHNGDNAVAARSPMKVRNGWWPMLASLMLAVPLVACGADPQSSTDTEQSISETSAPAEVPTPADPSTSQPPDSAAPELVEIAGLSSDPRITPAGLLASPEQCRIEDLSMERSDSSSGFPRPPEVDTTSNTKLLVVPVSTSDLKFGSADEEFLANSLQGTRDYYLAMSGGNVTVEWELLPLEDWPEFDVSAQNFVGGGQFSSREPAAQRVADWVSEKYPEADFDLLAIYFPADDSILFGEALDVSFAGRDGRVPALIVGGGYVRFWEVTAHEIGHSWLGLEDLYSFEDNTLPLGDWDLMQLALLVRGKTLVAWNRWLAGWLPDSSVRCLIEPGETVHYLASFAEGVGEPQMVVVPTGTGSAIVIETRRRSEFDDVDPTLIVYSVDTNNRSGFIPIRLDAEIIESGSSSTVGSVTVSLLDRADEGDLVSVSIL